jgi:hypothetical protein
MTLQDQIRLHKELSKKIEELEEQKKALGFEILQKMESNTLQIPGFIVRRINRLSIKLSIDEARAFNAIKLEEIVDKDKIKALYNSGHTIHGVSEIQYIQISEKSLD